MTEQINDPDRLEWPDWVIHVEPAGVAGWVMKIDGDLLGAPVRGAITMPSLAELHRIALLLDVHDAEALALRRRAALAEAVASRTGPANERGSEETWRQVPNPRWRTGRHVPRNLYIHSGDGDRGLYVGVVDWPGLAAEVCEAMNERNSVGAHSLINELRLLREEAGLSKAEAARRAGLTEGAISSWEIGRYGATVHGLERYAAVFGRSLGLIEASADAEDIDATA